MSNPNCPHKVPYVVATAPGGSTITLTVDGMVVVVCIPATVSAPFVVVDPCVATILDEPATPLIRSRLPYISATDELLLVYVMALVVGIL